MSNHTHGLWVSHMHMKSQLFCDCLWGSFLTSFSTSNSPKFTLIIILNLPKTYPNHYPKFIHDDSDIGFMFRRIDKNNVLHLCVRSNYRFVECSREICCHAMFFSFFFVEMISFSVICCIMVHF